MDFSTAWHCTAWRWHVSALEPTGWQAGWSFAVLLWQIAQPSDHRAQ
jgi:hypothetical protein